MNTNTELPATVYDEANGLTYDLVGDYYFPRLTVPEEPEGDIGRFGRMRKRFLNEHQPDTFALMLMESTLTQHLMDIDREAKEQIELITAQLARAEGVTEDLKARDQLGWIRAMNSCRARAEEQVLREIVLA
ncbi:MAG: TnpV protein [Bacteroidaceae bacterium]|nr:TnpV protein [Bacteroidaceae bacterium]